MSPSGSASIDINDLVALAQHYNSPASLEGDWAMAQSLVLEPVTTISTVAACTLVVARRRRR